MAKKTRTECWLEYAALRMACATVNAMPYPLACAAARVCAFVAFDVFRLKRKRTLERIRRAFPEKSAAEAVAIARFSLANIFQNAVELIRAPRLSKAWIDAHVRDAALYAKRLRELVDEGKGVVIMVPHTGNWYMAAWTMARHGLPLSAVAARQRNPLIDAWMGRQYNGIDVVIRGSAATTREVLARLRAGRAFAILPDLRVPRRDVEVPFLNGTANVSHGGALFAVAAGAPIVVAAMRRERGMHVFDHLATLRPDPSATDSRAEAARLTREAMRLLNAAVHKTPEQWFWFNKRWILEPVDR